MKVTIKVQRVNGDIETVVKDMALRCDDKLFCAMKKATREAGRGELLSYTNEFPAMTEAEVKKAMEASRNTIRRAYAMEHQKNEIKYNRDGGQVEIDIYGR